MDSKIVDSKRGRQRGLAAAGAAAAAAAKAAQASPPAAPRPAPVRRDGSVPPPAASTALTPPAAAVRRTLRLRAFCRISLVPVTSARSLPLSSSNTCARARIVRERERESGRACVCWSACRACVTEACPDTRGLGCGPARLGRYPDTRGSTRQLHPHLGHSTLIWARPLHPRVQRCTSTPSCTPLYPRMPRDWFLPVPAARPCLHRHRRLDWTHIDADRLVTGAAAAAAAAARPPLRLRGHARHACLTDNRRPFAQSNGHRRAMRSWAHVQLGDDCTCDWVIFESAIG
jgi:hypothetical protein